MLLFDNDKKICVFFFLHNTQILTHLLSHHIPNNDGNLLSGTVPVQLLSPRELCTG